MIQSKLAVTLALMLAFSSALQACSGLPQPSKKVLVVTTSNIVGDWVSNVGGDNVFVYSLLPIGADPHTYQPGAADVARTAEAKVLFCIGLGLEHEWLTRLLSNASEDPEKVVALGEYVQPLPAEPEDAEGPLDPHFWWDLMRVKLAVDQISLRLSDVDPDNSSVYQTNAARYAQELDALDARILTLTSQIRPERRRIVTSHETMQYFATRYGYEAVGSIFPGIGTDREPSAAELARLATKIEQIGVDVIFTEPIVTDRLARSIASETGATVVKLYSDSLGPAKSDATTFIGMMDTNMNLIYQALK